MSLSRAMPTSWRLTLLSLYMGPLVAFRVLLLVQASLSQAACAVTFWHCQMAFTRTALEPWAHLEYRVVAPITAMSSARARIAGNEYIGRHCLPGNHHSGALVLSVAAMAVCKGILPRNPHHGGIISVSLRDAVKGPECRLVEYRSLPKLPWW